MIEQQFNEAVRELVMQQLGENYEVSVHAVIKNNNVKLDSLIIRRENAVVMPSIYLNSFYTDYQEGRELDSIVDEIIEIYERNQEQKALELDFTYEEMKSTIMYRLVNYERNADELERIPYIPLEEFAIIFQCLVYNEGDQIGTVRISYEHIENWGITELELLEQACSNMIRLMPPTLRPMDDVIDDILWRDLKNQSADVTEQEETNELIELIMSRRKERRMPMYVLSNVYGSFGASSVLYVEFLNEFLKKKGEDFYMLPSSIHEVILVPQSFAPNQERLESMVSDINETQVPEQEYLSDRVHLLSEFCEAVPEIFWSQGFPAEAMPEFANRNKAELEEFMAGYMKEENNYQSICE